MAFEDVKQYFENVGMEDRVIELEKSSATVEEAANVIGCKPSQIAKTLSFLVDGKLILIVAAGDSKVDNRKYKNTFNEKAKMIPASQVETLIGHAPGGVCPFVINKEVAVYLDISLKRFEKVYPAGGNDHSTVYLSLDELEIHSHFIDWVDVCKDWSVDV